jgi:hypothetical protein
VLLCNYKDGGALHLSFFKVAVLLFVVFLFFVQVQGTKTFVD